MSDMPDHVDPLAELLEAAQSAEKTLRGMAQLQGTSENEDDAAIMLQKADRLRDAIASAKQPPD